MGLTAYHETKSHVPTVVHAHTRLLANCVMRTTHVDDDKENLGLARLLADAVGNRQWTNNNQSGCEPPVGEVCLHSLPSAVIGAC